MTADTLSTFELYLKYLEQRNYKMVLRFAYKIANGQSVQKANEFMEFFLKSDLKLQGYQCD